MILRLAGIGLGVIIVAALLQLPDPGRNMDVSRYASLPEADLYRMASEAWKSGARGRAMLILDYLHEAGTGDQAALESLREAYRREMLSDQTTAGRLDNAGYKSGINGDWYGNLSGATLADWFLYGDGSRAMDEAAQKSGDEFVKLLSKPLKVSVLFPQADPAIRILLAARLDGVLPDAMAAQLGACLRFVQETENQDQALVAFQETVMPLYQFAKKCRTWSEFEALVRAADSIDHVKALTVIASATPLNTRHLAQIAAVVDSRGLVGHAIGFVLKYGQPGLDRIYAALRKGPAGVQFAVEYPALSAEAISRGKYPATPAGRFVVEKWHSLYLLRGAWPLVLAKYLAVLLALVALLALIAPQRVVAARFISAGQTLPSSFAHFYRIGLWVTGAVIVLLLMIPMAGTSLSPGGQGAGSGGGPASGPLAAANDGQVLPLVILAVIVLAVQGICWWAARRKLDEIEFDSASDAARKLKRLENMEIFFDLPLYCGLALTILAFILISTFGAGVSRFLAYSSTFIGIIFSVVLRVWYVYPLREKLIVQKNT